MNVGIMEQAIRSADKAKIEVEPASFLERHFPGGPNIKRPKLVRITVADAYELLTAGRNPDNRPISAYKVAQFADDIGTGDWQVTGDTIKITAAGLLNDGQHRLEAIIKADRSIETFVVYGVSRKSRFAVDQGRIRGAGCYLGMGGMSYPDQVAAVTRMLIEFEKSNGRSIKREYSPTNAAIMKFVAVNGDAIKDAIASAAKFRNVTRGIATVTMFAFWTYLFRDNPVGLEYIWKVQTGDKISIGDTVFRVREKLASLTNQSRVRQTEVVLRGWTFYRDGKPWKAMHLNNELPKI